MRSFSAPPEPSLGRLDEVVGLPKSTSVMPRIGLASLCSYRYLPPDWQVVGGGGCQILAGWQLDINSHQNG